MRSSYLICSDLDDTLLTSQKDISPYSTQMIQKMSQNGHLFVLNTGRPYQGIFPYIRTLDLKNTPVIVLNGAAIIWPKENSIEIDRVVTFAISPTLFSTFFRLCFPYLESALVSSLRTLYAYQLSAIPFWILHINDFVTLKELNTPIEFEEEILNVSLQIKEDSISEFRKILEKEEFSSFLFTYWGHFDHIHSYELSSKEATKGKALLYLEKEGHIDHTHTIAFGDAQNDVSMLESAYEGVYMCDSKIEVAHLGEHFTTYNCDFDGVIQYLEEHHPSLFDDSTSDE